MGSVVRTCDILLCGYFVFFFQAEDGIRDLVRSRGLGDVYKRQTSARSVAMIAISARSHRGTETQRGQASRQACARSVSYTHLTLPTSDLV